MTLSSARFTCLRLAARRLLGALPGALPAVLTLGIGTPAAADMYIRGICWGENLLELQTADERAAMTAAIGSVAYPEGNLWQASGPDGTEITVFGTLHLDDPRHNWRISLIEPLLPQLDLLVVEATRETEAELQRVLMAEPDRMFINQGPSLLEQLGPEDWAMLKASMEARGVPGFMAAKFQPWYAALTLSIPLCMASDIESLAEGALDRRLIRMAEGLSIPVTPLDEVEALIAGLTSGSHEEQMDSLRLNIRLDLVSTDVISTMMDSYFAGRHRESWEFWRYLPPSAFDLNALDRAAVESEARRIEEILLRQRNLAWIGKILDLTRGKTAMVAVGAGHLSDEHGVLRQLELAGFALTRLDTPEAISSLMESRSGTSD